MKLLHVTKTSVKVLFLALALNACAGGEEMTEEPVNASNEANAANFESENELNAENGGNENENFGNENLGENENGNMNAGNNGNNLMNENTEGAETDAPANEFVNNAAGENFLNAGNGNVAAEEPAADPTADAALAENSSEDLGIAPSDDIVGGNQNTAPSEGNAQPNASMGATDASLAVPADSAPTQAAPAAAPMTGGRVHYVRKSGTSAYDKPSGQVVKTYEQGDHPLVSADGEWVQTSDGVYIPNSDLTTKPVSRAKSPKAWR